MFRVLATAAVLLAVSVAGLKRDRKTFCGSDTDCVVLTIASGGSQMKLDALDFGTDTVANIAKKTPSWFGPKRPVKFMLDGTAQLRDDATLTEQGVVVGSKVVVVSDTDGDL